MLRTSQDRQPATSPIRNGTIIEPPPGIHSARRGRGGLHAQSVVADQYTLEVSAPAMNFDPDQPDMPSSCQVYYARPSAVRLVDTDGTVLAT